MSQAKIASIKWEPDVLVLEDSTGVQTRICVAYFPGDEQKHAGEYPPKTMLAVVPLQNISEKRLREQNNWKRQAEMSDKIGRAGEVCSKRKRTQNERKIPRSLGAQQFLATRLA